jgi:HEPN domain-containing protein
MTRTEFQELAEVRLKEAETLLAAGLWDGAYYLAGYAVECGLKACIANLFKKESFPEKSFSDRCYTHDLGKLSELAELAGQLATERQTDTAFDIYWLTVKDWNESSRYERRMQTDTAALINAIADPTNGVLKWIKKHW